MSDMIDNDRVAAFAAEVAKLPKDVKGLDFYHTFDGKAHDAEMYPALNHPSAIDFFFFVCLHQYGFWHGDAKGYRAPMFATFDGKRVKGSDALWRSIKKALDREARDLDLHVLVNASEHHLFEKLFVHDDGPLPLPDSVTRLEITRAYARWFSRLPISPAEIVKKANLSQRPLKMFLSILKDIPGFERDPFQKKQRLLALALMNRPEAFLKPAADERLGPIVDYHLMRVALRLGLVRLNPDGAKLNAERSWSGPGNEMRVRAAVHEALIRVQELSGVSSATLDFAMWSARKYCPEMTEPECGKCRFNTVCEKRTELFQPVIRTTAY